MDGLVLRHEADPGRGAARAFRPFPSQAQGQPSRPAGLAPLLRRHRAQADPARLRRADRRPRRPSSRDHPRRRRIRGGAGARSPTACCAFRCARRRFAQPDFRGGAGSNRQVAPPIAFTPARVAVPPCSRMTSRRESSSPRGAASGAIRRSDAQHEPAAKLGRQAGRVEREFPAARRRSVRRQADPPSSPALRPLRRAPGRCGPAPTGSIQLRIAQSGA